MASNRYQKRKKNIRLPYVCKSKRKLFRDIETGVAIWSDTSIPKKYQPAAPR